jgi:predicted Fe-S protein YdhL (DUF1289 family)
MNPQDLADWSDAPVANVVVEPVWVKPDDAKALILERASAARQVTDKVPSPCISVCRMNQETWLCEGCYRSIEEICQWSAASDTDKKQMWALIEQRVAADLA